MAESNYFDLSKFPVFLPISRIAILWEFSVLIFIIADFVITVMVQCFVDYPQLSSILYNYFDSILVAILVLDILFTFNICTIKKGVVIFNRKQIAINYIKSIYFWVDVLSLLIAILQLALNKRDNYDTAYNFIVFIKVIKVHQFDKNIKRYALKSFNALLLYQIVKNIIFLALICHIIGCFFYFIDYNLLQDGYYDATISVNPYPYWLTSSSAYNNLINQDLWVKYTYCFYFSTSLLSGVAYGDLVPQNPIQTLYVTFILLFPLVIYSYIFNAIFNVISKKREKAKLIRKYQLITKRYLRTLRVKKNLQSKLITYLSFRFRRPASNNQFIDSLAPSAKKEYLNHTIKAKFDFAIFDQMLSISPSSDPLKFEEELMTLIQEESFPERYKLILPPNRFKLYYINQGICKRVACRNPMKYSDQYTRKQYFCYYPFLTGIFNEKLTYQSSSFVVAQSIDRKEFLDLLKKKQLFELRESFLMMKDEKILYHNETIDGELCFFCNSSSHMFEGCVHLRPKINFQNVQNRQKKRARTLTKIKTIQQGQKRRVFFRQTQKRKRLFQNNTYIFNKNDSSTFCEASIQCDSMNPAVQNYVLSPFQSQHSYKIYYPQYNISG